VLGAQVGAVILAASYAGAAPVPTEGGYVAAFWVSAGVGLAGAALAWMARPGRLERDGAPGSRVVPEGERRGRDGAGPPLVDAPRGGQRA
jgi:hypothetical protein